MTENTPGWSGAVRVGMFPPPDLVSRGPERAREYLAHAAEAGVDHVCCGDHVSFFVGTGFDGLMQATQLAMLHPALPVHVGIYLLPLRHPVLVARQLADFARVAPGRLVLGVGVGGEDRHEYEVCGVDPASRGRRMDECLAIVRQLLAGPAVSFHGEFFDLDEAVILPAPAVPIPFLVGGRSDAAVRRAGRARRWLARHLELARPVRRRRQAGGRGGGRRGPARAGPARHAGVVRARGLR